MTADMPSGPTDPPGRRKKQRNVKVESRSLKREQLKEDLSELRTAVDDFVSTTPPNSPETTHAADAIL